jgi:hypothetical protein
LDARRREQHDPAQNRLSAMTREALCILIIEDNPVLRENMAFALESAGHTISQASDGNSG